MDAKSAAVLPNMKKGHRATVNFLIKQGASTNNLKEMNSILFSLLIQIGQGDLATGCSLNIVYFIIHCNPSLPYIALRDLKALNEMQVYSHSYWLVIFSTTNSCRVLARDRWQTFKNS